MHKKKADCLQGRNCIQVRLLQATLDTTKQWSNATSKVVMGSNTAASILCPNCQSKVRVKLSSHRQDCLQFIYLF